VADAHEEQSDESPRGAPPVGRALWDGTRIREIRKHRGWSQHELAMRAGISRSEISRHERNDALSNPSVTGLLKIASALGVPAAALLEPVGRPIQDATAPAGPQPILNCNDRQMQEHISVLLAHVESLHGAARTAFIHSLVSLLKSCDHHRHGAFREFAHDDAIRHGEYE